MTPEAQRIAIAEACGWTKVAWYDLSDLNAMHEAEKVLTQTYPGPYQMTDYVDNLRKVVGGVPNCFAQFHATATQRAEAFLRTLNLWKP